MNPNESVIDRQHRDSDNSFTEVALKAGALARAGPSQRRVVIDFQQLDMAWSDPGRGATDQEVREAVRAVESGSGRSES